MSMTRVAAGLLTVTSLLTQGIYVSVRGTVALASPTHISHSVVALPPNRLFLGICDQYTRRFTSVEMDVEHDFVPWTNPAAMTRFLKAARGRHRFPLLTVEPWTTASRHTRRVLADTVAGTNDAIIQSNARAVKAQAPQTVAVRFAHEMELRTYPWATANAPLYIKAYRHYVDIFRKLGVTNAIWVWSPAGNQNATLYYPGSRYVDIVGLTVLGFGTWDKKFGAPRARTFKELFNLKYWVVQPYAKPIIIAELGVVANPAWKRADRYRYQTNWLWHARSDFSEYPLLRGVVYFNAINAPNPLGRPDFRIFPAMLWPASQMPPWPAHAARRK